MTILPRHKDVAKSRLKMSNPWHLLAVGFGSGLSPIVPGTMGSLAAIPFWYLMTFLPWQLYSLVVMLGICIGCLLYTSLNISYTEEPIIKIIAHKNMFRFTVLSFT